MKKVLVFLAAAALCVMSCTEEKQTIQFTKAQSVLLADSPLTVEMTVSEPVESSLTVPVSVSGTADKGTEYSLSSENFVFSVGSTSATIQVTPEENITEGKEINLTFAIPDGYQMGTTMTMVIAVEAKEKIAYSFSATSADLLNKCTVTLELQGMNTGKDFTATKDMEIPFTFDESSTAVLGEDFSIEGDSPVFKVAAGSNKGTATFVASDKDVELGSEKVIIVKVDESQISERFYAGNNASETIKVKGILRYSQLVGTWEFVEVPGLEDWEYFAMDMEDDPDLMPTHNTGYQISFTLEDGVLKIVPGSVSGDLNNYLRESELTYTAPVNMPTQSEKIGDYCSKEPYMWTSVELYLTYFELAKCNRAFSASTETIGKGALAMCFDEDGNLWMLTKDYDQPPFLENWWDGEFDADMYGFCYVMKKVK